MQQLSSDQPILRRSRAVVVLLALSAAVAKARPLLRLRRPAGRGRRRRPACRPSRRRPWVASRRARCRRRSGVSTAAAAGRRQSRARGFAVAARGASPSPAPAPGLPPAGAASRSIPEPVRPAPRQTEPPPVAEPPHVSRHDPSPVRQRPRRPRAPMSSATGARARASGSSCRVTLSSAPSAGPLQGVIIGCQSRELQRISAWELRGDEVYLYEPGVWRRGTPEAVGPAGSKALRPRRRADHSEQVAPQARHHGGETGRLAVVVVLVAARGDMVRPVAMTEPARLQRPAAAAPPPTLAATPKPCSESRPRRKRDLDLRQVARQRGAEGWV